MPRCQKAILVVSACLAYISACGQTIAPTQAWHHPIPGGSYAIDSGGIVNDARGYAYAFYADGQPDANTLRIGHILKLGPTNSTEWRKDIQPPNGTYKPYQLIITPKINNQQFMYAVGTGVPEGGFQNTIFVKKYDTAGTDLFPSGISINDLDVTPLGVGIASNGDLMIAAFVPAGLSGYLALYRIHSDGSVAEANNTGITPTQALYDPGTDHWLIAGTDTSDPQLAKWAAYSSGAAAPTFGQSAEGFSGASNKVSYSYLLSFMPNNQVLAALNVSNLDFTTSTTSHGYGLDMFDLQGNHQWTYASGSTGTTGEMVTQAVCYKVDSPIFLVNLQDNPVNGYPPEVLVAFDTLGTRLWERQQAPVQQLFACPTGFYDLFFWYFSTRSYLEHFDGGDLHTSSDQFDWGKGYPTSGTTNFNNALSQFQNCFWVSIQGAGSGNDLTIDRFVNGTALQSITAPSIFTAGNTLTVTINLNRAVQSGETVTVALNSGDPRVKLPNGQQGENFTIPVGQDAFNVDLTTSAGSYTVNLLAIQNGIRRTTSSNGS